MLILLLNILLSFVGSSLRDASSANSSNFCRSLIVSCGPSFKNMLFLREGTTCSSSTPSFARGLYCRLSIDRLRPSCEFER